MEVCVRVGVDYETRQEATRGEQELLRKGKGQEVRCNRKAERRLQGSKDTGKEGDWGWGWGEEKQQQKFCLKNAVMKPNSLYANKKAYALPLLRKFNI